MVIDRIHSLSRIGEVKAPILLLHGGATASSRSATAARCSMRRRSRRRAGSCPRPGTRISPASGASTRPPPSSSGGWA